MKEDPFAKKESSLEILDFQGVLKALQEHLGISESDLASFLTGNKNIPDSQKSGRWSVTRLEGPKVKLQKLKPGSTTDFAKFYCTIGTEKFGQFDQTAQRIVYRQIPKMLDREGRQGPKVGGGFMGHGPDKEGGGEGRS